MHIFHELHFKSRLILIGDRNRPQTSNCTEASHCPDVAPLPLHTRYSWTKLLWCNQPLFMTTTTSMYLTPSRYVHTCAGGRGRRRAENWLQHKIITCVHTCAVAERRRSGGKNRSAWNGFNTQFAASTTKPRAPNHHCPQEMADPPASAPRMCQHTRCSAAGMSKSTRLRSTTAPRMCERSFTHA